MAVGVTRSSPTVLETLADIIKHYVAEIGLQARAVAEHGGRADVTAVDILAALKQTGPEAVQWKDLKEFAFNESVSWQQPFHADIPRLRTSLCFPHAM